MLARGAQRLAGALPDNATAQHHDDAVAEREKLIEVGGDDQYAGPCPRGAAQLLVNARDGTEVDTTRRLRGEDDLERWP